MTDIPILKPESTKDDVAQASRCAIRTYANHIKYKNPARSQELLEYVRKLDARQEQAFYDQRAENIRKRNNRNCSVVIGVINQVAKLGEVEYSIEDLRVFLRKSRAFKDVLPFLSHTLSLLTEAKRIKIVDGFIQLHTFETHDQ